MFYQEPPFQNRPSYLRLFERHPQPMWIFDARSLRFLAVNDAALAAYGFSRDEFLAMTIADIRPAEDRGRLEQAVADASRQLVAAGIWRHRKKDGSLIDVKVTSNAIDYSGRDARLVLAEDVTAQNRLEEQLRQAQKMEAIGNLAGGIAHDFNNVLLVIRGHAAALLEELRDRPLSASVEQIDRAAERASEFTHQLLAFSRQQVLEPELIDVNALVAEMVEMLDPVLGSDVEVQLELDPDAASILIDRGQFAQAILNLVVNARDAMPNGGALTIRTANVELDEAFAAQEDDMDPGPHVLLQVSDSGVGMDAATRARVFEPFFTTKEEGTGFGLATVFGLVKQSNGTILVSSEPNRGARFTLYFPQARSGRTPPVVRPFEGSATILIVDDSEAVRLLISEMLDDEGHTVLTAGSGPEALDIAARHSGSIDLLVTDVVMPRMTGQELAEKVEEINPAVRVLFTSGLPADKVLGETQHAFIEKPFMAGELSRKVREVLA